MRELYKYVILCFLTACCVITTGLLSRVEAASKPASATATPVLDNQAVTRIYAGQSFELYVSLVNATPTSPTTSPTEDFKVELLGDRSENTQSLIIINGKRIDNSQKKHLYVFRLSPLKTGRLKTPEIEFETDGQTITASSCEIEVMPASAQDQIRLQVLATSYGKDILGKSIYPMQPFDVTVRVLVKALPGELSNRTPTSVLNSPPQLSIPWASDTLPPGLKAISDLSSWLGAYQQSGGFSINGYQRQLSAMDLLSDPFFNHGAPSALLSFLPTGKTVESPDAEGFNCTYYQYDFTRRFIAHQTGDYSFGPVSFKGVLATGLSNGTLTGDNIYSMAPAVLVSVSAPPETGRPDDYINAIGLFDMKAELSSSTARVGDPLSLTLTIRGEGTFDEMSAPDLSQNKAVTDNFRVYDTTERSGEGRVEYTYSLRPLNADVKSFPSVSASCFDIATGEYVQMKTKPIPLKIEKADSLLMSDIQSSGPPVAGTGLKSLQEGVHAYVTDLSRITDQRVRMDRFLGLFGSLVALYGVAVLGIVGFRCRNGNPVAVRRRKAESAALELLKQAPNGTQESEMDRAVRALNGFIADKLNVPAVGLTSSEAVELLKQTGHVSDALLLRAKEFLERSDWSRYMGGAESAEKRAENPIEQVRILIGALNRVL